MADGGEQEQVSEPEPEPEPEPCEACEEAEKGPSVSIDTSPLSNINKLIFASTAGMAATAFVHPFDVWKFNRQIDVYESGAKRTILERLYKAKGGWKGFMPGLTANLISQGTFVAVRVLTYYALLGEMDSVYSEGTEFNDQSRSLFYASCIGALLSTPAELALVQCAVDRQLPPRFRKYYYGGYSAMKRISSVNGIVGSFRGGVSTVNRTALATMVNFGIYNKVKEYISKSELLENQAASTTLNLILPAVVTSVITLPIDVIKTRFQSMKTCGARPEFCGVIPLAQSLVKTGYGNLFRGFVPYTIRIGLYNAAMIGIFNIFIKLANKNGDNKPAEAPAESPPPSDSGAEDPGSEEKPKSRRLRRRK